MEQRLGAEDLEFHGVCATLGGGVDELEGFLERAVVIDADLGNDERRVRGADGALVDQDRGKGHDAILSVSAD
jgi:hypothetical protein